LKKIRTKVTDANDGMHNPREFQKAREMLEQNRYINPRLYHLTLTGSEQVSAYQEATKALCAHLRRHGMPCQWRACVEDDEDKGLHWHVYILVESKHSNPDHILNRKDQGWLQIMVLKKGIDFYLNAPRDRMHWTEDGKQLNYATLPKSKPEKLANCIEWISYLYKTRSKPKMRQIYFSSRQSREKLPAK
jgi:hypothetical protein